MKQEIKFKFWDTKKKIMTCPHTLNDIAQLWNYFPENIIPRQFTGEIAIKNKEIYFGDIVRISDGGKILNELPVGIEDAGFVFIYPDSTPEKRHFVNITYYTDCEDIGFVCEVIGNIYEGINARKKDTQTSQT